MTDSIIEIQKVKVQPPEWQVTLHLYVCQYVQEWGNTCMCDSTSEGGETLVRATVRLRVGKHLYV